jgi:hypothetical protein
VAAAPHSHTDTCAHTLPPPPPAPASRAPQADNILLSNEGEVVLADLGVAAARMRAVSLVNMDSQVGHGRGAARRGRWPLGVLGVGQPPA